MKKKLLFLISGGLIICSTFLPYLIIVFTSPQYPDRNPKMYLYVDRLEGDMQEWEHMGWYIGIDVTPDLPELENNTFLDILIILGLLVVITAFLNNRLKKAASILLLTCGLVMAGWAQYRLYLQGHDLDPKAPMRFVVKPFTPPLIGVTKVSKIRIYHLPHLGSLLFILGAGIIFYTAWWKKDELNQM